SPANKIPLALETRIREDLLFGRALHAFLSRNSAKGLGPQYGVCHTVVRRIEQGRYAPQSPRLQAWEVSDISIRIALYRKYLPLRRRYSLRGIALHHGVCHATVSRVATDLFKLKRNPSMEKTLCSSMTSTKCRPKQSLVCQFTCGLTI